ncbi:MAG: matrixin family metalloprotease, partial [Candidatus Aenigmatarchaeota archaeon]
MNIVNSVIGIVILAILIIIGYKVGQMVIELNTPIIPKTSTAELTIPEQPSTTAIRWNHFPLTVYINGDFIRQKNPEYMADVRHALDIWQSTGIVSFTVVDNLEADITIEWAPNLKEKATDTLGNTDLKFINISQFGIIQNAKIQLLIKSDSRELSSNDMVNLALHEIGHALGLQHTNEDDIMNPVLIIPSKSVKEISADNINNLQKLYELAAKPDLKIAGVNATKFSFSRFGKDYFYLNISTSLQNVGLV